MVAYTGFHNVTCSGGTADSADSFSIPSITLYYSSTSSGYSPNLPPSEPRDLDPEKKLKAVLRTQSRDLSLQAQRELSELHHQVEVREGHGRRTWHRRPTKRSSSTATRNFRRAR